MLSTLVLEIEVNTRVRLSYLKPLKAILIFLQILERIFPRTIIAILLTHIQIYFLFELLDISIFLQ